MAFGTPQVVVASGAQATNGNSAALSTSDLGNALNLLVSVTAISGTPSMAVTIEWSMDGTLFAPGDPSDAFTTPFTAVSATVKSFEVKAPFFRVKWVITGGTPSLTFSVTAYVTP